MVMEVVLPPLRPLFLCTEVNFRQISFSGTQTTRKEPESIHSRHFYDGAVSGLAKMRGAWDERGRIYGRNP